MKSIRAVQYFGALLLIVSSVSLTVSAQQGPAHLEPVLVPISVFSVPGAYGTVWSTELWYRNNSTEAVVIWPLAVADWYPGIGRTERLLIGYFPADAPGQIIFVGRNGGDEVQFDLRIFNRAKHEDSWGTKIPVVREHEFRTSEEWSKSRKRDRVNKSPDWCTSALSMVEVVRCHRCVTSQEDGFESSVTGANARRR